jgi:hypothetical protein
MGKINWSRVLLGGVLAGIVINVIEGVSGILYMEEMQKILQAHNISMGEDPGSMVIYLLLGFVFGILGVWIYAAIRPRFGMGPKTALKAAIVVWIFYLGSIAGWASLGLYPTYILIMWAVVGLIETILAIMLGAWLYKEQEAAAI